MRNTLEITEKPEDKSSPERPRRRWEDNIKMYLPEFMWLNIGSSGNLMRYVWGRRRITPSVPLRVVRGDGRRLSASEELCSI
jgi:hypothetical protein